MILKVIVDNNTYIDKYYYGEPSVCYYIEDEGKKILLDVGYSKLFLDNMYNMGLDIDSIDTIVISHGHDDHTRGLKYLFDGDKKRNISIVAHDYAFEEKVFEGMYIGSPFSKEQLSKKCDLILTKEHMKISENIIYLGEIPEILEFEKRKSIGKTKRDGKSVEDLLFDDSALVYKGKEGIYIITGCSHSGICNIVEYAKQVTKCDNVIGIIGGFHLFDINDSVNKAIEYFKQNNIKELYPCHCTSFKVKSAINNVIPIEEVGVSLTINWH